MATGGETLAEIDRDDLPAGPVSAARAGAHFRAAFLTAGEQEPPKAPG